MVVDYRGEALRRSVAELREKRYRDRGELCYLFKVDEERVVDATMASNYARMMNHSCNPNCFAKIFDVEVKDGHPSAIIVIIARRPIRMGEELTYDYRFDREEKDRVPCRCGAATCRSFMN
ncbi:unnamed protein product [Closterium sp. Yama58-4]|nr:unnamed protein product [Closterium sp. Yama58-4]